MAEPSTRLTPHQAFVSVGRLQRQIVFRPVDTEGPSDFRLEVRTRGFTSAVRKTMRSAKIDQNARIPLIKCRAARSGSDNPVGKAQHPRLHVLWMPSTSIEFRPQNQIEIAIFRLPGYRPMTIVIVHVYRHIAAT